jgi:transcriptional regulator with XRE-family HTH domain
MSLKDTIKNLCKMHRITMNAVEEQLGFASGYLSKLDKSTPNTKRIQQIADYFGVTVDYLMNGEEPRQTDKFALTDRDNKDIAKDMESIRAKLTNKEDGPVSFDGQDIDEAEVELVLDSIEMMLKRLKRINKEKYNPNKNKDKK